MDDFIEIDKIEAVIFDMDGLLIDSEPVWADVQIEIMKNLGVELTKEECKSFQGAKLQTVVNEKLLPKINFSVDANYLENLILQKIEEEISNAEILPGVMETIDFFYQNQIPTAIASGSAMKLIENVVEKLDIKQKITLLHSAEFEKKGKPHPDIFLTVAEKLNKNPENILVFEDSGNGILAAKSAGMIAIAVPYAENFNDTVYLQADCKFLSMNEFLKHIKNGKRLLCS